MIRTPVMSAEEGVQVFVDTTGRRKRLLAVAGVLVALFAALYMGVVGASVVQASDSALTARATVSTSATVGASATATATATAAASSASG
ncbi:hypothetical protein Acy02nite_59050 [Actinoplanes cyaneus]|uniref:Uncharacterized protein n=1 Tax=Actinoplanes cyaneus TaxID=52696 RepID=A0A919ILD5_9ACTN|nr:hypothetical protein [Actinoplanes cyaneus]MCW2141364.1 hypothetical protein [Actinoplanes cyaneus]GID68024.1 hypothetical protein Acy02nite_59050 [Actinoplanes cyaneus]